MKDNEKIMYLLGVYLNNNPSIRFTQALFNLGITEFADGKNPELKEYLLRNNYNDSDSNVVGRIKRNG